MSWYLLTKIDQIDPVPLDSIAFVQQLIVLKLKVCLFADGVIRKERLLRDLIKEKNSLQYLLMQ